MTQHFLLRSGPGLRWGPTDSSGWPSRYALGPVEPDTGAYVTFRVPTGNLALNFANGRGDAWLALSAVIVAGAFCSVLWALAASLFARRRAARAA